MIVDVASNDYESYQLVIDEVGTWAKKDNVPHSPNEITAALAEALNKGFVRAYLYSQSESKFKPVIPDTRAWKDYYFLATAEGKNLLA